MVKDTYTVLAGWLLDGGGLGPRRNIFVAVSDGIVRQISEKDPCEAFHDLSDFTLMPGLVDSHVHLCLSGTREVALRKAQLSGRYQDLLPLMIERVRRCHALGIAGLRDGGDYGGFSMRFRLEDQGHWTSLLVLRSGGRAWHAEGRYGNLLGRAPAPGVSLAEAIKTCGDPCDHVKIVNSGVVGLKDFRSVGRAQFNRDELKSAVDAAHSRGLSVMVHANGPTAVADAIWAGCDTIEHGFFMGEENIERMADRGTYWIPTIYAMEALALSFSEGSREREVALMCVQHQLDQLAVASQRGVRIALGTDSGSLGVNHGTSLGHEIRLFMKAGIEPHRIVAYAAGNGSRILGAGTFEIREGAPALMVAVKGDPSEALADFSAAERKVFF